ncbi:MAG: 50S ribosomal protein L11 methyltransferase [Dehalococcoidia bacterium]
MPTPDDRWYEAVARVDARDADLVADVLSGAGATGISIEPAIRVQDNADFAYEELMDEPWTVRATFLEPFEDAEQDEVRALIADLELAGTLTSFTIAEAEPVDWAEEWKKFYRRQRIGERLVIVPSWEEYQPAEGEVAVLLDPGAAFGTGEHETTRLCLAALEARVEDGQRVLDVGAGSGILAIAARILGAGEVHAIDIDPDTVRVAEENAATNGIAGTIDFAAGSLGDRWPWSGRPDRAPEGYNLVLANISSTVIGLLAAELARAVAPGGILVASGFILRDADEVRSALAAAGLSELNYRTEGNWGCLVVTR